MEPDIESSAVKLFSSKRRRVTAAAIILLGLFLLRPGISSLKWRIANSISRALARPVDVGAVHVRFLPPGFDLQNLVIHEDPAFGAEPMLRAQEVTATVRLTSLLRGHLDISRLLLTEPSLNLVRRGDGRWNWEGLLVRTAQSPLAPTAKAKLESRPGFPYIKASSGRINFKSGPEKKSYALLNADFAVWQDSENAWGMRLSAQPLRTDMSLSDTGLLQVDGKWQRSGDTNEIPLQINLEWNHAQLGQLTKLISGSDKGWRGEVRLDETLNGSPSALAVAADISIEDFHRYDIPSGEGLRLAAHCDGNYSSADAMMRDIRCSAPVGSGLITLHGDAGLPGVHKTNVSLHVEGVPASALAELARRAKRNIPADLVSLGSVQGEFSAKEDGTAAGLEFEGRGEITNLHLASVDTKVEFSPGIVPFVLNSGHEVTKAKLGGAHALDRNTLPPPQDLHIEYGPFPVALGRPTAAQARGWIGRGGYGMMIRGEGEVSRTLRLASLLGLTAVKPNVEGLAQMDLQIAGSWIRDVGALGFSAPKVTGIAQLHNMKSVMRGVNGPIEVSSAELKLLPDVVRVEKLSAQAANAHWTGSAVMARGCGSLGACVVHFSLNTEDVSLRALHEWFATRRAEHRWYQMLSSTEPTAPSLLQSLRASGTVSARRLLIHSLVASNASAMLELDRGKLKISDWRADMMGGKYRGDWQIDFSGADPFYAGSGSFAGISLGQVAEAMHDPWIAGTAAGTYQIESAGGDSIAFWQGAEGELQFDIRDGVLPHIALAGEDEPLKLVQWRGTAKLRHGKIALEPGELISSDGEYELTGTASLGRELDLKLSRGADDKAGQTGVMIYAITGTVEEPVVARVIAPVTQAKLKP